jgi:hypothetical protein
MGGKFVHESWASSTVKTWSESPRLANFLFTNRPDVIFFVVGANETHYVAPDLVHNIKAIVAQISTKPCVILGPPIWDWQAGIVDILRANAGRCAFIDSTHMTLKRQKDGMHPSLEGGATWASAAWTATIDE